eukprot:1192259-Prorocentrum_minimum.AAC.2
MRTTNLLRESLDPHKHVYYFYFPSAGAARGARGGVAVACLHTLDHLTYVAPSPFAILRQTLSVVSLVVYWLVSDAAGGARGAVAGVPPRSWHGGGEGRADPLQGGGAQDGGVRADVHATTCRVSRRRARVEDCAGARVR